MASSEPLPAASKAREILIGFSSVVIPSSFDFDFTERMPDSEVLFV